MFECLAYMNVCTWSQNRTLGPLRLELGGYETPCGCCEQKPAPLAEQPVLSPSSPCLPEAGFLCGTQGRGLCCAPYVLTASECITQLPVATVSSFQSISLGRRWFVLFWTSALAPLCAQQALTNPDLPVPAPGSRLFLSGSLSIL